MGNSHSKAVRRCISEYVQMYSIRGLDRKKKSWGGTDGFFTLPGG